jgi:toxin CcdB
MAQFDVFRAPDGTLVVDCQSDFLSSLPTRYVIPLYGKSDADWTFARLTPQLPVREQTYTLATPLGAAIDVQELGQPLGSVAEHRYTILDALDLLLTGI